MIYLRVRPRVTANVDEALWLKDVAGFIADARYKLNEMRIILPKGAGVWQVDAPQLIMQIMDQHPRETVRVLGDGIGWLHREKKKKDARSQKDSVRHSFARNAVSLFSFSALLLLLFFIGRDGLKWNALPYVASLLLGAAAYFARSRSVPSPVPKRGTLWGRAASLFSKRSRHTRHIADSTEFIATESNGKRATRSAEKRMKR